MNLAIYLPPNTDYSSPSVRLRLVNIRKALVRLGIFSQYIYDTDDLIYFDAVLFGHLSQEILDSSKTLRSLEKTLLFSHTEQLWDLQFQKEIFNLCDYIVCCSDILRDFTASRVSPSTKCVTIPDVPDPTSLEATHKQRDRLICMYVGMGGNAYLAKNLEPLLNKCGYELVLVTEHVEGPGKADILWDIDTYQKQMCEVADIVICPQNVDLQPAKSHIKAVTAMQLGLPIIASPLDSYKKLIHHGINGYIAHTEAEWEKSLIELRDHRTRTVVGKEARESVQFLTQDWFAGKISKLIKTPKKVRIINSTLPEKYMSYGDHVVEAFRANKYKTETLPYEDVSYISDNITNIVIEQRFDSALLPFSSINILILNEPPQWNQIFHYDWIYTQREEIYERLVTRGFINIKLVSIPDIPLQNFNEDFIEHRIKHNFEIHNKHINIFEKLQEPQSRWGAPREKLHIDFTESHLKENSAILDVGSADGWLAIYLALKNHSVATLDFVDRGQSWLEFQEKKHNIEIKKYFSSIEKFECDDRFDVVLAYEILEHLDYTLIPFYLKKLLSLTKPEGTLLISLPSQDLENNKEHLWTPSLETIIKAFSEFNYELDYQEISDHSVPGNWFLRIKNS